MKTRSFVQSYPGLGTGTLEYSRVTRESLAQSGNTVPVVPSPVPRSCILAPNELKTCLSAHQNRFLVGRSILKTDFIPKTNLNNESKQDTVCRRLWIPHSGWARSSFKFVFPGVDTFVSEPDFAPLQNR